MKHNFPDTMNVICSKKLNKGELKQIIGIAFDAGIKINSDNLPDKSYPYTYCSEEHELSCCNLSNPESNDMIVSWEEFKAFFLGKGNYTPPFKERIVLTSSYTAIVTKENIAVGCTIFSHQKLEELYLSSLKSQK